MARYAPVTSLIEAGQWHRPGDIEGDKPVLHGDGAIVKRYQCRDKEKPEDFCPTCNVQLRNHGWIPDPVAPPDSRYPVKYVKEGKHRECLTVEEEIDAQRDGAVYVPELPQLPQSKKGVLVHPGWFVVKVSGSYQCLQKDDFRSKYSAVQG